MTNNDFGPLGKTIVNKEKTNFEGACNFCRLRYNISTLKA